MSKDTETQLQTTNSYTSITRSSGPSKTGCAKCDAKKLPNCVCSKSGSEKNEFEEETSAPAEKTKNINSMQQTSHFSTPYFRSAEELNKEEPILLLSGPQHEFQFTLKPNVKIIDIKALLEQFIIELANNSNNGLSNQNLTIKELGEKLGIYYTDSEQESLVIKIENQEFFAKFLNRLVNNNLIEIPQKLKQTMDSLTHQEIGQSFNPSPFKMTLTPY